MRLKQTQIAMFREQGFLNVGQVFSGSELEEIAREYGRFVTWEGMTLGSEEDGKYPYRAMLSFRSPVLKKYINHRELVPIMVQLPGPDLRFWWDQGINKAPGSGSHIPWHQDNGYHHGAVPEYITTWLALDDSSSENGGLFVIPGSHRSGDREHAPWGTAQWHIPDVDQAAAIPLDARAGDTLVFSSLLIHQPSAIARRTGNAVPG